MARTKLGSLLKRWLPPEAAPAPPEGEREERHFSVRFEHQDLNARNVLLTGFGVLAGTLIVIVIAFPIFKYLASYRAASTSTLPVTRGQTQVPPEPRLQDNPTRDYREFSAAEDSALQTYRWIDRAHGVVSIPVDRAIQLTAQRGLAPRKAPPGNVYYDPHEGSRLTGFEGKVEPEPR